MGISPEHHRKCIKELSSDVAPGLRGSKNVHITSIILLDKFDVPSLAKAAVDCVHMLANIIHMGNMSDIFYIAYLATRLMLATRSILTLSNQVKPCHAAPSTLLGLVGVSLQKYALNPS
eukprot:11224517-Ditylum_brightwellii.AAC.1